MSSSRIATVFLLCLLPAAARLRAASLDDLRDQAQTAQQHWEQLRQVADGLVPAEDLQRAELAVHESRALVARRQRIILDELTHLARAVRIREQFVRRYRTLVEQSAVSQSDLDRELASMLAIKVRAARVVGQPTAEQKALIRLLEVQTRQATRSARLLANRMATRDEADHARTSAETTRQRLRQVQQQIERQRKNQIHRRENSQRFI